MSADARRQMLVPLLVAIVSCGQPADHTNSVLASQREARSSATSGPPNVEFGCRLPVASLGTKGSGGFIQFPQATFVPDLASDVAYDAAVHRWLPVRASLIAPDGRSYAESIPAGAATRVRLVDALSGSSRNVWSGYGNWRAVGYVPALLYTLRIYPAINQYASSTYQVYVLDVRSPKPNPKLIGPPSPSEWTLWGPPSAGAMWGIAVGSPPRLPPYPTPTSGLRIYMDTVIRMDLLTGAIQTFVTLPGMNLSLLGFDSGNRPIVAMRGYSTPINRVALITGPDSIADLFRGADLGLEPWSALSDQHGIWFDSPSTQSIWLYDVKAGLRRVYAFPRPTPQPTPSREQSAGLGGPARLLTQRVLAGPCE